MMLVEFLQKQQERMELQEVLMTDLPQLLCQNKVPIYDFLNIVHDEFFVGLASAKEKHIVCNMELYFKNKDLPFLGPAEINYNTLAINNLFNITFESEQSIIE